MKELKELIKNLGDGVYKFKIKNGKIIDLTYEKKIDLEDKWLDFFDLVLYNIYIRRWEEWQL